MKLRINLRNVRKSIDVPQGGDTQLKQLKIDLAEELHLQNKEFEISLNGNENLEGDEKRLSELGIVSGDLIFLVLENSENVAEQTTQCQKKLSREFPSTSQQQFETVESDLKRQTRSIASPEEMESTELETDPEETNTVIISKCLSEPLLCRESTATSIPPRLQQLYTHTQCSDKNDALWIVIHTLMLESGFVNIHETATDDDSMPDGWKGNSHYTGKYYHIDVSNDVSCKLVGLPMGSKIIIHGQVSGSFETKQIHITAADYVGALHKDGAQCYKNLHKLSLLVKDSITLPLLQEFITELGLPQSFGFMGLNFELKLKILSYLDVVSLLRFGEVCQQMNNLHKDPYLWRRLYISTFGGRSNTNLSQDWLEIFKEKYKMRKEFYKRMQHSAFISPSYSWHQQPRPYPPFAPVYPNHGIVGGDYDLNPQFPGVNPLLGRHPRSGLEMMRPRYDPIGPIPDPGLLLDRRRNNRPQHWFGGAMGNKFF